MKIAVEGCAHGELEKIYDTIAHLEVQNNVKVDLLLCCGDFQASRNLSDLECMAVPPKYRQICTFYKYYSGEKTAPILTIVIGGNHEASNYFQELPYGGWLAPNIYYLGYANVIQVADVRIAGLSGIFKFQDYQKGRFEVVPYNEGTKRSCYHVRALDVFRLKQISRPLDIMLSHDWPEGVYNHGNVDALLRRKPFFKDEIERNRLGSPVSAELLHELRPKHWFAAHLHVKFPAVIRHEDGSETKFLALDKCLPRRQFLQVLDVPHCGDIELKYDEEWCAILSLTDHLTNVSATPTYLPGPGSNERWNFKPTVEEKEEVRERLGVDFRVPNNFVHTAPSYNQTAARKPPSCAPNPQTDQFCQKLGIADPLRLLLQKTPKRERGNESSTSLNYSSFNMSENDSVEFSSPVRQPSSKNDSQNSFYSFSPLNLLNPKPTPDSSTSPIPSFSPRTPMNLPAPKNFEPNTSSEILSESSVGESQKELGNNGKCPVSSTPKSGQSNEPVISYDIDTTPTPAISEELSSPGPKRFRRRNVALYTITGNDDY